MGVADGAPLDCWASAPHGRYLCGKAVTVEATLGITPPLDGSGEYGKFWPGMRVHTKDAGTAVTLRFSRVDARSGKLRLLSTVSGSVELFVRTPRGDTHPVHLSGNKVQLISLPAGLSRAAPLELHVTSPGGGTDAILRGELLP